MSKMLAAPPDVVRWVTRSGDHDDCGVAAVALACGVTYEIALRAILLVEPNVLNGGIHWTNIRKAVRGLGWRIKTLPFAKIDLDSMTGILELEPIQKSANHVVYLWMGRIVEPKLDRRELWENPEQFLNHYGYRVGRLLTLEGESGKSRT